MQIILFLVTYGLLKRTDMPTFGIMLQKAHAGEIAAYHAYLGHAKTNPALRKEILRIRRDEAHHVCEIRRMMRLSGVKPSPLRDFLMSMIGRVCSALCFVTTKSQANFGARVLERIGTVAYCEMAKQSPRFRKTLLEMAEVEQRHAAFFEGNP